MVQASVSAYLAASKLKSSTRLTMKAIANAMAFLFVAEQTAHPLS